LNNEYPKTESICHGEHLVGGTKIDLAAEYLNGGRITAKLNLDNEISC